MRKIIRKILPDRKTIHHQLGHSSFVTKIQEGDYFHVNRRSVCRGLAIGLFVAFMPIPFQMIIAASLAIYFRSNIIIAIAATWVTNPFTFIPFNYFIFTVGHYITQNNEVYHNIPSIHFHSLHPAQIGSDIIEWLKQAGISFLVGVPVVATSVASFGYLFMNIIWRCHIYYHVSKRRR